jgi:hypothetical protein
VLAIAVASATLLNRDDQPTHNGKSLSEWLEVYRTECLNSMTGLPTRHDQESGCAICAIGTNALPKLLEWVAFEPPHPNIRIWVGSLLLKLRFAAAGGNIVRWSQYQREARRATTASMAFGALGTNAQSAILELAGLINSGYPPTADNAICALQNIGAPAIPSLLAHLANTNAPNRSMVARRIGWTPSLATNDTRVVTQLLSCLNDSDKTVEEHSAISLNQIVQRYAPQPEVVVPAIIGKLPQSRGFRTHPALVNTLGAYGPKARPAIPVLQELLNAANEADRVRATNALMRIAPEVLPDAIPQEPLGFLPDFLISK